jgi:hypothetical protein
VSRARLWTQDKSLVRRVPNVGERVPGMSREGDKGQGVMRLESKGWGKDKGRAGGARPSRDSDGQPGPGGAVIAGISCPCERMPAIRRARLDGQLSRTRPVPGPCQWLPQCVGDRQLRAWRPSVLGGWRALLPDARPCGRSTDLGAAGTSADRLFCGQHQSGCPIWWYVDVLACSSPWLLACFHVLQDAVRSTDRLMTTIEYY